jgi:hypothetical protein
MKLNKKGTKVKLGSKMELVGVSALLVQYGIPIAYISHQYGLITRENETYSATGGLIIVIMLAYLALRNKIKQFISDYNTHLSTTAQRMKSGVAWLTIGLVVWFATIYLSAFLWLCVTLGGSTLLSYPIWAKYDVACLERKELQAELDKQRNETKLSTLQKLQQTQKV